ncbi:hypothetical protein F5X68DRAFT_230302 [Plectosphaerella plurivora]|uniref:Uncharacterized protein n=1 Tax=Plectosphaerella plurivora TaxID=936078 RepID=A0A9P8VDT9_9PEZI|nr:hypothetical protein F5X68DRAFT_230302 [Plectosphaerella plurivora]
MAELPWYGSLTIFLVVIIIFVLLMVYHRAIGKLFGSCHSKWEDRRKRRAAATAAPQPPQRPRRPFDINPPPEPAFDAAGLKEVNLVADVEAQTVDKKPAGSLFIRLYIRSLFIRSLFIRSLSIRSLLVRRTRR